MVRNGDSRLCEQTLVLRPGEPHSVAPFVGQRRCASETSGSASRLSHCGQKSCAGSPPSLASVGACTKLVLATACLAAIMRSSRSQAAISLGAGPTTSGAQIVGGVRLWAPQQLLLHRRVRRLRPPACPHDLRVVAVEPGRVVSHLGLWQSVTPCVFF